MSALRLALLLGAIRACAADNGLSLLTASPNFWSATKLNLLGPPSRVFASACVWNEQVYVLGGLGEPFNTNKPEQLLSELWTFYPASNVWSVRTGSNGTVVWPMCSMLQTSVTYQNSMIVFGGYTTDYCSSPDSILDPAVLSNAMFIFNYTYATWVQISQPSTGSWPLPRAAHAAVVAGDYMLVWGGLMSHEGWRLLSDFWAFDLQQHTWRLLSNSTPPGARYGQGSAINNNTLYIAGGCQDVVNYCTSDRYLLDTWTYTPSTADFSEGVWRNINPNSPIVYFGQLVVMYPNTLQATLFSVSNNDSSYSMPLNGNNNAWSQVTPTMLSQFFPSRFGEVAVWLPNRQTIFVYGGFNLFCYPPVVWEWSPAANAWFMRDNSPLLDGIAGGAITTKTGKLSQTSLVSNGCVLLFGGMTSDQDFSNVLYAIFALTDGLLFTQVLFVADSPAPSARMYHSLNNLAGGANATIYLFGGWGYGVVFGDLWYLNVDSTDEFASWQYINTSQQAAPSARCMHASAIGNDFVTGDPVMVIYGGLVNGSPFWAAHLLGTKLGTVNAETWQFNHRTQLWTMLFNNTGPPPLASGTMSYIFKMSAFVLYGGFVDSMNPVSQAWMLSANGWQVLSPIATSPIPPARGMHAMTNVYGTQVLVVSGGQNANATGLNDTWLMQVNAVDLTVEWTELVSSYSPYLTAHAIVAASPYEDSFYWFTFGGFKGSPSSSPTWATPVYAMYPACNPGSVGQIGRCVPCPQGSQSPLVGGQSCIPCPAGTTTAAASASSVLQCAVCSDGWCSGHGTCAVQFSGGVPGPVCDCNGAWSGSRCTVPWPAIVFCSLLAAAVIIVVWVRLRRRSSQVRELQHEGELKQRLLEQNELELSEYKEASMVDFNDVTIKSKVDQGAFGDIFEATYRDFHVAVKTLRANLLEMDASLAQEMEREIEFMRTVRHSNLIFFFGGGRFPDGNAFIVVEWAARGSLHRLLRNPAVDLSAAQRLLFVHQTALGMRFLHSKQCIHRDLKSGNILISEAWTAKVSDFGTAKLVKTLRYGGREEPLPSEHDGPTSKDSKDDLLLTKGVGTLLWCAPEILSGRRYGLPADVYSFGIVMWEIWTRQLPFEHLQNKWAIIEAVESGQRPPVMTDAPPGYVELMERCWDGDPARRPTFDECVAVLKPMLEPGN